ncbi:MAG TPA: radical SAM protein, partial [Candidatus Eisenbacteria bacterium]|nr:radical SAM protein [Candidatus Eisenbacteria bacterium]
ERAVLDRRSDELATALLEPLTTGQRARLVGAMADVERMLTAALVEIDAETQPTVTRILAQPESAVTPQEREIHDGLLEGGFIVPSEHDEIAVLKAKQIDRRTCNPDFFLTIAPTLACNFACEYCFQRHETGHMTRETEAALVRFSEEHIPGSRSLFVTWFGGEPTLCLSTIERLQEAFSALASRHGVTVHPAAIVSNGSRLDGNVATRLRSAGVAAAQVTLDGPEAEHDRRRHLRGGQGTFRSILRNLTEAADILRITVRVNVDRKNVAGAPEVLRELRESGLLSRVQIYFAPVKESTGACADMTGRCFTNEEFARVQLEIYENLVARGFTEVEYPEPAPGGYCGADTENGYVVAPNGLLFKCWEELSLNGAKSVG